MPALLLRALAIAVLGFAFAANASDVAPDLELHDLKGASHKLADYRGKPVVLNFWATWCVPCATEMPLLAEMQKRYQGKVVFIAASVDFEDVKPSIPAFIKKHHAGDLTVMTGAELDSLHDFGLQDAMPGTVFIDAEGNIVGRVSGELKRDELEAQMQKLAGAPGSLPKDGQKPAEKAAK
jgi:thiol-disulfide isomerase/thioredoxin